VVPEISPGPEFTTSRPLARTPPWSLVEVNLPNLITLARLLVVPVAIWLIVEERYGAAFWVFIGAGLSDGLDGYIAKRFDRRTRLGAVLDPAADKALLAGMAVTLGLVGQLPAWLVVLIVLRDALIVLGFAMIQTIAAPNRFDPLYISKVNTLVQIVLVGFVLARLGLGAEARLLTSLLIAAAAVTTVTSGLSYLARWTRILTGSGAAL